MSAYRWTCEWAREHRVATIAELETTSTNQRAKDDLSRLAARTALYITDHQTAGRGRGDNQWSEQPGHSLLSSWVFSSDKAPQPVFSIKAGLALYDAAKSTWPKVRFQLKAPNDLHVLDHGGVAAKIAGLLIEVVSLNDMANRDAGHSAIVIGLGLNTLGAPSGTLPYPATCLAKECAKAEQPLCEADFRNFLTVWHAACTKLVKGADASKLSSHETQALKAAMAHHPEAQGLKQVTVDGSLIFDNGRTVSWSDL